jgi:hypothetical protein
MRSSLIPPLWVGISAQTFVVLLPNMVLNICWLIWL